MNRERTAYLTALVLVGFGAALSVISVMSHMIQLGATELWSSVLALGLILLGAIIMITAIYLEKLVQFKHFALLLILILTLGAAAFHALDRAMLR